MTSFRYEIVVRSGVLVFACTDDFLKLIQRARAAKAEYQRELPNSRVRVRLYYPNGLRVSRDDIKCALVALSSDRVSRLLAKRIRGNFDNAPARSEARTAAGSNLPVLGGFGGCGFSQAGVVAPPDSPDLGNFGNFGDSAFRV